MKYSDIVTIHIFLFYHYFQFQAINIYLTQQNANCNYISVIIKLNLMICLSIFD